MIIWILTGVNVVVCVLSAINTLKVQKDLRIIQELIFTEEEEPEHKGTFEDPLPPPKYGPPKITLL